MYIMCTKRVGGGAIKLGAILQMVLDGFWVRMYFSYTADVYMYKKKISFFHQLQNVWTFSGRYLLHTASILKILS